MNGAFAYALAAGMVAAVNPCGFAMLPAYLSYFLGIEGHADDRSSSARLGRALVVSAAVTLGFVTVFLAVGLLVNAGLSELVDYMKYASIAIGVGLVALGIAILCGYRLPFTTPRLDRGGRTRSFGSMLVFGVSYAVASIGCTLPIFMVVLFGQLFVGNDVVSGVLGTVVYGLGMGLVLTALTVTLAVAEGGLLRVLRKAMTWVDRLAGVFLILAGAYLVYYWVVTLRFERTRSRDANGLADWVETQSAEITSWVQARPWTLLVVTGLVLVVALAVVLVRRRPGRPGPPPEGEPTPPAPRHEQPVDAPA